MKNRIIVKPAAGLANRLRVIESGLSLARSLDQPLRVVWVTDSEMVANYEDLFEPADLFEVCHRDEYRYVRSSFSLRGWKKAASRLINRFYGIDLAFSDLDITPLIESNQIDLAESCRNKNVYFLTCKRFYLFSYNYSWLRPLPEIQQRVDDFRRRIGNHRCVGLHIRRTDSVKSIELSPDSLFEEAIELELERDPATVFFLATDDSTTQERIVEKYAATRIMVQRKLFGRDSVEATQDALVDLLSLASCQKLYRSYWSAFSDTAAILSGAETVICRIEHDGHGSQPVN